MIATGDIVLISGPWKWNVRDLDNEGTISKREGLLGIVILAQSLNELYNVVYVPYTDETVLYHDHELTRMVPSF